MSRYYKPNRKPDWNYGGSSFRLSRSKIGLFLECPRCFYLDNKLGVARPPGFPFSLNSAVDVLFKKEFDVHRKKGSPHPLMVEYDLEAVPFSHPDLDVWRENFKGVEVKHQATGFVVSGALDDVWVNKKGELIVVDYKSTSKDRKIDSLNEPWQDGYKRQMEVYQWLLRERGFNVSNTGYFVYANASKEEESFGGRLLFEVTLVPYIGSSKWVEGALRAIKECLDGEKLPASAAECDYCSYRHAAETVLARFSLAPLKKSTRRKAEKKITKKISQSLF